MKVKLEIELQEAEIIFKALKVIDAESNAHLLSGACAFRHHQFGLLARPACAEKG